MRFSLLGTALLVTVSAPALAADGKVNLLEPHGGLMFWTLLIFVGLLFVLSRYAFKPLLAAVEAREASLQSAMDSARRDRDAAAVLLAEQQKQLEAARAEAQKYIADSRAIAEKMRTDLLAETKHQQQELLDRARREIEEQKSRAILELRKEAIDLAIAGASKVIERNLDDASNRRIVEQFLTTIPAPTKS